ncbi:MAG: hypothetical protein ABI255_09045 [Microbacteriaceae bacterium]
MTVWQDPPPQTRRQAREAERARAKQQSSGRSKAKAEAEGAAEAPLDDPGDTDASNPHTAARNEGESFDSLLAPSDDDDPGKPGLFRPELSENASDPITEPVGPIPAEAQSGPAESGPAESGPEASPPAEKTLTRRELRALKQAREANDRAAHGQEKPAGSDDAVETTAPETDDDAPILHRGSYVMPAPPSGASDAGELQQPPVGHWSNVADHEQTDGEHRELRYDQRESGHRVVGATTTSALILPSIPNSGEINRPIASTGEILVTGSIEVPHSFAASGHRPSMFDSSDIDRLFDQSEADADTGTVAPVRASRAVSTHTSTRGVIAPQRGHGAALPMVLAITAGVLALGVIGLLVAGFVLRIF